MIRPTIRVFFVITALALSLPVAAQTSDRFEQPEQAQEAPIAVRSAQVIALINGELEAPLEEVFAPEFLSAIPPAQLNAISGQLTAQFGRALAVEKIEPASGTRSALEIRMERAIAKGGIAIDPGSNNRITELVFRTFDPVANGDSTAKISAELEALPGTVSAWFAPLGGGEPIIAVNPEKALAIGSTFKLYVLAALAEDIARGERKWDDVVALDTTSFPSGMMQDWPQGAPVTLHTLASLMISISDNTATDQLIKVVGRDRVLDTMARSGHAAPKSNDPFMTTRELFLLKGGPAERVAEFAAADSDARRQILETLEENPASMEQIQAAFSNGPVAIDIEWLASAADLANLYRFMRETADPGAFEILGINPNGPSGAANPWAYTGFKGGSEPGVLNLTWFLKGADGTDYVLTLGWNNPDKNVEQATLDALGKRILALPR